MTEIVRKENCRHQRYLSGVDVTDEIDIKRLKVTSATSVTSRILSLVNGETFPSLSIKGAFDWTYHATSQKELGKRIFRRYWRCWRYLKSLAIVFVVTSTAVGNVFFDLRPKPPVYASSEGIVPSRDSNHLR